MFNRPDKTARAGLSAGNTHFRASLAGICLLTAGLAGSCVTPVGAADTQAQDVLKKMTAVYAVQTFEGTASMNLKGTIEDNKVPKPYNVSGVQEVTFKSPNMFYIKASGKAVGGVQIRVCDGKESVNYVSAQNKYMKFPLPPAVAAKMVIPVLSMFGVQYDIQSGKLLNSTTVSDKPAYVVQVMPPIPLLKPDAPAKAKADYEAFKKTLSPFEMVIDKKDYHLLRVTQSQHSPAGNMTKTLDLTRQTFNPTLVNSVFVFTPPAGAKQVTPRAKGSSGMNAPGGVAAQPNGAAGHVSRGAGNPVPPPHASPGNSSGTSH